MELKRDDIGLLISLVTQDIDRAGEVKEEYGFCDPSYFYHLVDIRNKLLVMPVAKELPGGFNDEKVGGLSDVGINRKSRSLDGVLTERGGGEEVLTGGESCSGENIKSDYRR